MRLTRRALLPYHVAMAQTTRTPRTTAPPRRPRARRLLRWTALLLASIALLLIVAAGAGWAVLRASLPDREGERALAGLSAPARVSFDALGVPAIEAATRNDVARALGFVHAQDRFFQMDLTRRDAAGELAELLGSALLPRDRVTRRHRFRDLARRVIAAAEPGERAAIEAYAEGVNAGLEALGARPFEYIVLRARPVPWRPEDTMLATLAMFLVLQDHDGHRESSVGVMHDLLPGPLFDFLAPSGTEWDAPVAGGPLPAPALPGPETIHLRAGGPDRAAAPPVESAPVELFS